MTRDPYLLAGLYLVEQCEKFCLDFGRAQVSVHMVIILVIAGEAMPVRATAAPAIFAAAKNRC